MPESLGLVPRPQNKKGGKYEKVNQTVEVLQLWYMGMFELDRQVNASGNLNCEGKNFASS